MLRQIIAAVFLFAFCMQTFSKAIIAVNFYANRTEIAQALCENKDKPQMNCCGKCQLKKRLSKQDKAEDKERDRKSENKTDVTSAASFFPEYTFASFVNEPHYPDLAIGDPTDITSDFFRPPSI